MPSDASLAWSRSAPWALRNREPGKLCASSLATACGVRRSGGGRRVSTEKVSKAAWPLSPQLRSAMAFLVAWWCWCPATASATATLASIRSSGRSPLVGIAQCPDEVVADAGVGGRDDEKAVFVLQVVVGERLYVQPGSFRGHLDLAGHQAEAVPQHLRDNQSACLVDG